LYEIDRISGESIFSGESDIEDFEFDPTNVLSTSIISENIFMDVDLNSLPIVFDDGLVFGLENYETDNTINNKTINVNINEMADDEESLIGIHRDGLVWNNEFRHFKRNNLFVQPIGPTEDVNEKLLEPISAF
jgi:hypothetical protein